MAKYEDPNQLDYRNGGDTVDDFAQKYMRTIAYVFKALNDLRTPTGNTAGVEPEPYMWRIADNKLYIRNADNTDYVLLGDISPNFGFRQSVNDRFLTTADLEGDGAVVTRNEAGKVEGDITGSPGKIAGKTIDVTPTADNDVIAYDAAQQKWVKKTLNDYLKKQGGDAGWDEMVDEVADQVIEDITPIIFNFWYLDDDGYLVPLVGSTEGGLPSIHGMVGDYEQITARSVDVAGNLSATGNVTAGMVTTPQANVTTLTANAVNAGNVTKVLNTVNDMLSDNLSVGMTARTLGYYAVDDGCGETYSIINSSEIPVDGDKIIQLNNGLYAKRITQSDLPDIFLGGFFTSDSDTQVQLYASDNGINFNKLTALNINSRDVSIRYYNQCFYLVKSEGGTATFTLYKSKDLKTWESEDFTVINRGGNAVWAPDLFIDDDGSAYVYFAYQWGTERVGESTQDYPALDMYVSRCSNIENAEFETAVSMNLPTFNDDVTVVRGNNIDGHVFKNDDVYYLIVKSDHQLSLQNDGGWLGINLHLLKSANAMTDWTEVTTFPLKWIKGIEGASVVIKNDMVYMYADAHGSLTLPYFNHDNYGGTWCWRARLSDLENGVYNIAPITTNQNNRHGCVIDISANYAKRILTTFNPTFIKTDTQNSSNIFIPLRNANGGSAQNPCNITKFVPVQNVIYTVGAGFYTIDGIKNVNQATDFYIRMETGNDARIHIKNDTGDNRDLWIGNGRNINGQILHFYLRGNEIMYVGNVATLCQSMCYGVVGPAALLASFDVTSPRTILLKVNVCSSSYPSDLTVYTNEFLIRVYNSSLDGIGAKIKRLSEQRYIDVKLINTETGIYQLWGKSPTEGLCLSIEEIMTGDRQANPFNVISFPLVTADDFPAGTEVTIE